MAKPNASWAVGSASNDKATLAGPRVVTFETPARPIAANVAGMEEAVFDLLAVIGDKYDHGKKPVGLSFTFRPLGGTTGDRSLTELSFRIAIGTEQAVFTASIKAENAKSLCGVHFSVVDRANNESDVSGICVFDDGSAQEVAPKRVQFSIAAQMAAETVSVRAEQFKGPAGEYWGDLSMLTVQAAEHPTSFSWNWLFTGRGDLGAADAVTPARLLKVPEAEARIIAVSPPIPLGR